MGAGIGGVPAVGGGGIGGAPHFNSMAPGIHGSAGMAKFSHPPRMPRMGPQLGKGIAGFDSGGEVGPGDAGLAPSAATANPVVAGQVQNYQRMSAEQLQELAARLGPTSQGQLVQRVLAQKRMSGGDQTTTAPAPQTTAQYADGGAADDNVPGQGFDLEPLPQSGLLHSAVAGRTDHINTKVPSGGYVVPADLVSGIGEGNTLAGARTLHETMKGTGPYGVPIPKLKQEHTMPRPPAAARAAGGGIHIKPEHEGLLHENMHIAKGKPISTKALHGAEKGASPAEKKRIVFAENARKWHHAEGGKADGDRHAGKPVPILAAGGEFVISPDDVKRFWGGGDIKRGHANLDEWVMHERKKIAKKMLALPGPAQD